uniref:Acyltransferase n=1 Tax=Solanum tuberosum TaxID=4113 RepID=M1A5J9_SOLTU
MISIISKKIITPNPSTQRWHKLSILDQCLTHFYMPFVFFYPKNQVNVIPNGPKQLSNSLSKTSSYYYPWAGSLKDNATIECDDHGAELLQVQINSPMGKVVDSNIKDLTFPQGDGSSAYFFLRDWAALTRSSNANPSPYFVEDSIVPSPISPLVSPVIGSDMDKCVQKRFIFSSTKLSALKSSIGVQNVTSNEAVNAIIYKCVASSATIVNSGSFKLSQFFDLREIISPPNSIDLDFGFGKPIRASFAKGPRNKFIILMRTYDGGIEALVNLNEQEMCVFEHDKQLLEFAIPINGDFCYEEEQHYI